jgi:hypothetical protein
MMLGRVRGELAVRLVIITLSKEFIPQKYHIFEDSERKKPQDFL